MDKPKEYELLGRVYQSPLSTLKEIIQEHGIVQSGKIEGLDHGSALELVVKWIQKELQSVIRRPSCQLMILYLSL